MQLNSSAELVSDVNDIIGNSVKDPQTIRYVTNLLLSPPIAGMKEIRLNFQVGIDSEFFELKLMGLKDTGDKCLVTGIFYLDQIFRRDNSASYMLLDLGRTSYNIAGVYASVTGQDGDYNVFSELSERFIPVVAELSYRMRRRLGDLNPPERIVMQTPYGDRLLISNQ